MNSSQIKRRTFVKATSGVTVATILGEEMMRNALYGEEDTSGKPYRIMIEGDASIVKQITSGNALHSMISATDLTPTGDSWDGESFSEPSNVADTDYTFTELYVRIRSVIERPVNDNELGHTFKITITDADTDNATIAIEPTENDEGIYQKPSDTENGNGKNEDKAGIAAIVYIDPDSDTDKELTVNYFCDAAWDDEFAVEAVGGTKPQDTGSYKTLSDQRNNWGSFVPVNSTVSGPGYFETCNPYDALDFWWANKDEGQQSGSHATNDNWRQDPTEPRPELSDEVAGAKSQHLKSKLKFKLTKDYDEEYMVDQGN